MTVEQLAKDLALEIMYGCDRFDKHDIEYVIESNEISREALEAEVYVQVDKLCRNTGFFPEEFKKEVRQWCY